MNLQDKISNDWKSSLKNKDVRKKKILTIVRSEIKNEQIKKKTSTLNDEDVCTVIRSLVKQSKETMDLIQGKGVPEEVSSLAMDILVLEEYLPKQMTEAEVYSEVDMLLSTGNYSADNFGLAMKDVMSKLKGLADGKIIQKAVKERLG